MIKKIYICDRCKKEGNIDWILKIERPSYNPYQNAEPNRPDIDLCHQCFVEIMIYERIN